MPVAAPTLRALPQKPRNKPEQKSINTNRLLEFSVVALGATAPDLARFNTGALQGILFWLGQSESQRRFFYPQRAVLFLSNQAGMDRLAEPGDCRY